MNKTLAIIATLILVAIVAAGVVYIYAQTKTAPVTTSSTTTATPTDTSSPTASASPTTTSIASPSPTTSSTPNASLTSTDNLSVANQLEILAPGGSLSTLSSKYNISISRLAQLNGIANPDSVYAGETIIVPDSVDATNTTILFVLNKLRQTSEASKIAGGLVSIYSDSVSAAQHDINGINGLKTDTPYSKTNPTDTAVTLTNSTGNYLTTVSMSKTTDNLWYATKLTIQNNAPASTPAP